MDKEYLLHDSPLKALLIFTIPMMIGNLFQQLYVIADAVIVGRLVGEKALAAVGASYALTNVFICIAIGGGVGSAVIIGRYFGAREYKKLKLAASTALISFLSISMILAFFGLLYSEQILIYLDTPSNILAMAVKYLDIYFLSLPFLFMYNVISSMFNAIGRSRIPLYLLICSSILNVTLGLYFVTNLQLGITGVAWATFFAQGLAAFSAFALFLWEMSTYPRTETGFFDLREFRRMSLVAMPSILQQSTISIGMMLVQSVVNLFGSEMLAGFSAAMRIESLCLVPLIALGNAMSAYTAQNIGAGSATRVRLGYQTAKNIIIIIAISICLLLELGHEKIILLFLGQDATAVALATGSSYLQFMGWFFVIIGLKMSIDGLLRGAGDMKMFTLANMVNLTIRVCFAVIFAPRYGIAMVWYVVPLGWLANLLISYYAYHSNKWSKPSLSP